MSYLDKFNVFMQYATGNGGGGGGGVPSLSLGGVGENPVFNFVDSPYNFTDPPRYFKANDPYYFEVDNIPLKQIQENCLWLKDQIENLNLDVTGLSTAKITDLKPHVNNSDRTLFVNPGRFTARVNDAYSLTLSDFFFPDPDAPRATIDVAANPIYQPPSINISEGAFRTVVGQEVLKILYSNGLFSHLQHHQSIITSDPVDTGSVPGGPINLTFNVEAGNFEDIPKVRTAIWQSYNNYPEPSTNLQNLAVDFCRRWQGIFRTAVVNVKEGLSVDIPYFENDDFLDNYGPSDPQVRIDLVFVYTHPIDAQETHIISGDESSPERITQPRLGVVKGAGAILTPKSGAPDIINDNSLIGTPPDWPVPNATNSQGFYDTSQVLNPGQDAAIESTMADQVALNIDNNPFGTGLSFPSPDDLMNLAPIVSQDVVDGTFATVGQSVLPLCYVLVRKGEPVLTSEDIIDIRPFLRTAELAYNERAGIGGANPPLSLANPAVGKAELYKAIEMIRNFATAYTDELIPTLSQQFTIERTVYLPEAYSVFRASPAALGDSAGPTDHFFTDAIALEHRGKVTGIMYRLFSDPDDTGTLTRVFSRGGTDKEGNEIFTDDRLIGQFESTNDPETASSPHSFTFPPIFIAPTDAGSGSYKMTVYSNSRDGAYKFNCFIDGYIFEEDIRVEF